MATASAGTRALGPGRLTGSVLSSLRAYWGTAALAAATGALALMAVLPVTRLATPGGAGSRLRAPVPSPFDAGFLWINAPQGPAELRQAAVALLFKLLLGVAWGLVAVALLTLVALCVARASARGPEIAIRRAVGASSRALLAGQLVEGAIVGAGALLVGGALGSAAEGFLAATWPWSLEPSGGHLGAFAATVVTGTILLGALLPVAIVRRPARSSTVDPTPLALVVPAVQLGLSLTVLGAAAMLRVGAGRVAPAVTAAGADDRVYRVNAASLPASARAAGYAHLLQSLAADHSVALAGLSSSGALVGLGHVGTAVGESAFYAVHHVLSADSFQLLRLRVVAGRALSSADDWSAPRVVVVNRTLARRVAPLGSTIALGYGPDREHKVVGVVDDVAPPGLGGTLEPRYVVYASILQHPAAGADLVVRSAGAESPAAVHSAMRSALGPVAALSGPVSEASVLAAEAAPLRWFARALDGEGWVMLAVASLGTFSVMWLWVTSVLGELGLRRATGARRRQIMRYVLARAAAVAAWGAAFGAWVGLMVWDAVHALAETLPAWDPAGVARAALLLGAAALAGALVPAWRAARTPPAALVTLGGF